MSLRARRSSPPVNPLDRSGSGKPLDRAGVLDPGAGRDEDAIATILMPRPSWLPPVDKPEDLPRSGVSEGALCYVDAQDASGDTDPQVWQYTCGAWVLVG